LNAIPNFAVVEYSFELLFLDALQSFYLRERELAAFSP
jgi:hypothetical protein